MWSWSWKKSLPFATLAVRKPISLIFWCLDSALTSFVFLPACAYIRSSEMIQCTVLWKFQLNLPILPIQRTIFEWSSAMALLARSPHCSISCSDVAFILLVVYPWASIYDKILLSQYAIWRHHSLWFLSSAPNFSLTRFRFLLFLIAHEFEASTLDITMLDNHLKELSDLNGRRRPAVEH